MKWFKHLSRSLNNSFVFELIEKFGGDGYMVFFGTLELMSDEFDIYNPGIVRLRIKKLTQNLQLSRQKTLKVLRFCDEKANENRKKNVAFFVDIQKTHVVINCRKLAELCDTHTQKLIKDTSKSLQSSFEATSSQEEEEEEEEETTSPAGNHFKNKVGDYLETILEEIETINKYPQNGKPLNKKVLFQWLQEKANMNGHPKAMCESLGWLRICLEGGEDIKSFRGFAESTFKTKNPNYHGRDSEAESDAFKNIIIENDRIKQLLQGFGEEK